MIGCSKRYEHSSIKWMPFTHLPDLVWNTPTWSCDEESLQQSVQWEISRHTHNYHGTLVLSAELGCWHEVNMSNVCHNMLDVNGKAIEVVDWQASTIDEPCHWKAYMHTIHLVADCCGSSLSSGSACWSNVHCSARYENSHVRTKITIVQAC
jgi:hypothetical protein